MRSITTVLLLISLLSLGNGLPGRREESPDSFRRLLRRSAVPAESDVTLIREERGLRDDFENDDFITRKRRSDEDKFYQTLLTRAESRQQDKRSFDTDDVDNKAGVIVREDWTGDSKISDADRKELENLFESLNPDDPEKPKQEEVRDAEKEPESVKGYARDYTDWLMTQPPSQMTQSLNHKVDVDHKLSKMFYRSSIPGAGCSDKSPRCVCTRTCHPYPVVNFSPCHCSASMPKVAAKSTANQVKGKIASHAFPQTKGFTQSGKIRSVNLPPLCSDKSADCLCRKACYPKPVATATPCNCGADSAPPPPPSPSPAPSPALPMPAVKPQPAAAKPANPAIQRALVNVNAALAKLCKQDSPQCLCARACYPQPIVSAHPCQCLQGINGPNKPSPLSAPASAAGGSAAPPAPSLPENKAQAIPIITESGSLADQTLAGVAPPQPAVSQPKVGMGLPQTAMAQPQGAMAQPQTAIAQPQGAMAQPQAAMAQPQAAMAQPQAAMAQPQAAMAQPQAAMAQPQTAMAQPQAAMEQPQAAMGLPQSASATSQTPALPEAMPLPQTASAVAAPAVSLDKAEVEWCKRACHPRPVSKPDPCNCEAPGSSPPPPPAPAPSPAPAAPPVSAPASGPAPSPAQAPAQVAAPFVPPPAATNNAVAEHACRRTCFPHPVASTNPCNCSPGSAPPPPPPSPAPPPASLAFAGRQPAPSIWYPGPPAPARTRVPYYNSAWKSSAVPNSLVSKAKQRH